MTAETIGYVIRRTLKKELVQEYEEEAKEKGSKFFSHPEYIHPAEGYWSATGNPPLTHLGLGWQTPEEAVQALTQERAKAIEHGYLDHWEKYDYRLVKVTVAEEEMPDGFRELLVAQP